MKFTNNDLLIDLEIHDWYNLYNIPLINIIYKIINNFFKLCFYIQVTTICIKIIIYVF